VRNIAVGEEEFLASIAPWLMIGLIIILAAAVGVMLNGIIAYLALAQQEFKVCDATIYVNSSSIPVKLYYAWNERLMTEGYRNKDSYDFNNVGAVGMLFVVNCSDVEITMRNVKLPLVAVLYRREDCCSRRLVPVESLLLEPGKEYPIPRVYAFVEYNPEFFDKYLKGAIHVLEIEECR